MNNPFLDKPLTRDEKDYEDYLGVGEAHHPPPKKFKPNVEDEPEPKSADVFDTPESQEDSIFEEPPIESPRGTPEEVASKDVFDVSDELVADSPEEEEEPRRVRAASEMSEELGEKSFMTDMDATLTPGKMKWRGDERREKRIQKALLEESPKSSASTSSFPMPILEPAVAQESPSPKSASGKTAMTPVTKSSKQLSQIEINEAESPEIPKTHSETESSPGASSSAVGSTRRRASRTPLNSELSDLLKAFEEKNLIFQPDLEKVDRSQNLVYCEIPNVRTTRKNFSNYRSVQMSDHAVSKAERRVLMDNFLQSYKEKGFWSFVTLLNKLHDQKFDLCGLRRWYDAESERLGQDGALDEKLANVVRLALMDEEVLPENISCLQPGVESVTLSQKQCAVFLAKAMFTRDGFLAILMKNNDLGREKCKFLFTYFSAVSAQMPDGNVSFRLINYEPSAERIMVNDSTNFVVKLDNDLTIEESALCTQVDFANARLGGGVLNNGMVQEEIRFMMCPEMIVSRWIMPAKMSHRQAVSIVGAQVYSSYEGYGHTTKWAPLQPRHALSNNLEHRDKYRRLRFECLAIDAIPFERNSLQRQLDTPFLLREINKAIAGFSSQPAGFEDIPIWSGWWGCGAFQGNKALKFLVQVIAARIANRPLRFCTFGDLSNSANCEKFISLINEKNVSVGQLLHHLTTARHIPRGYSEIHIFEAILSDIHVAERNSEMPE